MKLRWTLFASAGLAVILSFSLLALPVGCGDSDDGDNSLTLSEYCSAAINLFCEKRIACWSAAALAYEGYSTQAECEDAFTDTCPALVARWQTSIDDSRLQYSGAKAKTCINTLRGADCATFQQDTTNLFSQCQGVLTGMVGLNGTCRFLSLECGTGMWCEPSGFPEVTCKTGTCATAQKEGQSCDEEQGVVCEFGLKCVAGTCTGPSGVGGSCGELVAECEAGLKCGSDKKCYELVRIGESCDASGAGGDLCDGYSFCYNGTCTGLPKEGEACGGDRPTTECWLGWCKDAVAPDPGSCAALPKLGEECDDQSKKCQEGRCDLTQSPTICVNFKALGQTCEESSECETLVCHPTDLNCVEEYCP